MLTCLDGYIIRFYIFFFELCGCLVLLFPPLIDGGFSFSITQRHPPSPSPLLITSLHDPTHVAQCHRRAPCSERVPTHAFIGTLREGIGAPGSHRDVFVLWRSVFVLLAQSVSPRMLP